MRRALLVAVLLVAACGGGGGDDEEASASGSVDVDVTTTTSADDGTSDTTAVEAGGETATTAPAGADAPPTTVILGGEAAVPDSAVATGGAPQPVAPGTYRYRQTGSASGGGQTYDSPPEGTMVVDAAGADGRQLFHRYVDPEGKPADSTVRFGADGMFIEKLVLRQGEGEITCTFDPAIPSPPWPPTVGSTFSATGECGIFTLEIDGRVTGTRSVDLDGRSYEAFVVESTIHAQTPQLTLDGTQVDWFVPELRLATHTESTMNGKFGTTTFESSGAADLLSAVPA